MSSSPRLVIASNRLPFTVDRADTGVGLVPACGGLAAALTSVHARPGNVWVGWPGDCSDLDQQQRAELWGALRARRVVPVELTPSGAGCVLRRHLQQRAVARAALPDRSHSGRAAGLPGIPYGQRTVCREAGRHTPRRGHDLDPRLPSPAHAGAGPGAAAGCPDRVLFSHTLSFCRRVSSPPLAP